MPTVRKLFKLQTDVVTEADFGQRHIEIENVEGEEGAPHMKRTSRHRTGQSMRVGMHPKNFMDWASRWGNDDPDAYSQPGKMRPTWWKRTLVTASVAEETREVTNRKRVRIVLQRGGDNAGEQIEVEYSSGTEGELYVVAGPDKGSESCQRLLEHASPHPLMALWNRNPQVLGIWNLWVVVLVSGLGSNEASDTFTTGLHETTPTRIPMQPIYASFSGPRDSQVAPAVPYQSF